MAMRRRLLLVAVLLVGCQQPATEPTPPGRVYTDAAAAAPATGTVSTRQKRAAQDGSVYVLAIGINEYKDTRITRLTFAEQDARGVYDFFSGDREGTRVRLLTGNEATRAAVVDAVREHLARGAVREGDVAVLYFSGHGFRDAQGSYLACHDTNLDALLATAISTAALHEPWEQIRAQRKVLIVDACHSGGLPHLKGIGGVSLAPLEAGEAVAGPEAPFKDTFILCATGPNELSVEDPELGQGVFTVALLKGLRGEADHDRDGRVSGSELSAYLPAEVGALAARANGRQTPRIRLPAGTTIYLTE